MAGGLSTQNFMSGLADGLNTGLALRNANEARDDRQAERERQKVLQQRQDVTWDQSQQDRQDGLKQRSILREREQTLFDQSQEQYKQGQEEKQRAKLMRDFQQDLRASHLNDTQFTPEQIAKYEPLGSKRLFDKQWQESRIKTGQQLVKSLESGKFDENFLDALNGMVGYRLDARTEKDGLKRKITGIRKMKNGNWGIELDVTGKDGEPYKAPLTKNGTSDKTDEVIELTPQKLNEWIEAGVSQADTAYKMSKAKSGKEQANVAHQVVFGQSLEPKPEFDYHRGFDENGNDQLFRTDSNGGYSKVGGGKARDPKDPKILPEDKMLNDALTTFVKNAAEVGYEKAAKLFHQQTGFTMQDYEAVLQQKREKFDASPVTYKDMAVRMIGLAHKKTGNDDDNINDPPQVSVPPRPDRSASNNVNINNNSLGLDLGGMFM